MIKITVITSLFNCEKFLEGYFFHVLNIVNKEECEFLLLHNAPQKDELEIIKSKIVNMPYVKHIIIPERENLYVTWNRGCKMARGEYIAIWNVDDIRFPDSLKLQAEALDIYSKVGMPYGNFYHTSKYGDLKGKLLNERDCKIYSFLPKVSHLVGCFPMWRKSVHEEIGYFDEQFRLVSDFDFQIRVARKYKLYKIDAILGCYLSDDPGRLSKNSELQSRELVAVEWRYGIFYKTNLLALAKAYNYKWDCILSEGVMHKVTDYIKNQKYIRFICSPLLVLALIKLPLYIIRYYRHSHNRK